MVFTKQEILENFPLADRLRLERTKSQNSIVFWINELVSQSVPGVNDVPELISHNRSVTEQLEELYKEKELLFSAFPGIQSVEEIISMVKNMEEQLIDLYKDKEV